MAVLIAFYSLTGTTRTVVTELAPHLQADIEEIRCARYGVSFRGWWRAAADSWRGRLPGIAPATHTARNYDLVVLAGPIWAWHPCPPLRAYVRRERADLLETALLLTHGGSAGQQSLDALQAWVGKPPKARVTITAAEMKSGTYAETVAHFAQTIRPRPPLAPVPPAHVPEVLP
ncbi:MULTISPECIES: flavodoxin family protein [Nitrospirillum]|uniref:Flavodoxin n=1 Tax=Nitrospirillum amazonense TaxID=28077 RepID=A0A560FRH7_9PROT|nr:hypothetical protein [Nitrospirillum amazonense]MEC4591469.1 hypothetical protein [Nitrospirillum amazonense]TWB24192.1 hypothetical protein FBZ88_11244 [Nitrospirillum amazonense]